jgi:hypothetical protein
LDPQEAEQKRMRLVEHAKQVLHQAGSLDWKMMKIFIDIHSFFLNLIDTP